MMDELPKKAKTKYEVHVDGRPRGCILDPATEEAVCYAENEDGERIQGTFKTLEDDNTIRTVPVTPISAKNPQDAESLLGFVADNLPIFQKQMRDRLGRSQGLAAQGLETLKRIRGGE